MKTFLFIIVLAMPILGFAQARIVFQGGTMLLTNNATLVLANPSPDALTVSGAGGIISEGAENNLLWYVGNHSAQYQVPFISGGIPIPVSFSTNGGTADGYFKLSTYAGTNWQNSNFLPPTVTSIDRDGVDNSNHVIDRFWQINATGYTTAPALSNLVFSYRENEWSEAGNQIIESDMVAQNWDDQTNIWLDPAPGTENAALNQFLLPSPVPATTHPWWTLVSADFPLPLTLLDFTVTKQGTEAAIHWLVTRQINVDHFELQRSSDAVNFTGIAEIQAMFSNSPTIPYNYTDRIPVTATGFVYYRLKMLDKDGKFSYSPVKNISINGDQQPLIQCFPNPVTNLAILRFGAVPAGPYFVHIVSASGMEISNIQLSISPNATCYLSRDPRIVPGIYIITVTGAQFNHSFRMIYR